MTERDQKLERARRAARLTTEELWLRYFALGGMSTASEVEAILRDALVPTSHDRTLLTVALNERFAELGGGRPLAFLDEEA